MISVLLLYTIAQSTQLLGCVVCKALVEEAWYAVADWVLLHRTLPQRSDVEQALQDICERAVR